MTTTPNTETQELKEFIKDGFAQMSRDMDRQFYQLDKKIDNKFNELDKKIDHNQFELQQQINSTKSELQEKILKLEGDIKTVDARQKNVETAIQKIPEITEKFGELKNWRQIAFVVIAAAVSWFARGQN